MQQHAIPVHQRVLRMTGDIFPYSARHLPARRRIQETSPIFMKAHMKPVTSLPDYQFPLAHFPDRSAQICGETIFSVSVEEESDSSRKTDSRQRDRRRCKHD